ncbi:MAG: NADH-quinone oxidoreductase subunit 5 family protein [Sphingobacterium sp.]
MNELLPISPINASVLIALLPFLAFLIQAVLGKTQTSGNISLVAIILSTTLSLFWVFPAVWNHDQQTLKLVWFVIGEYDLNVGVLLNNLTVLMQLIVCIIALPVHIYSKAYMKADPGLHRYWMFLSLFCFAMLSLTISINLFQSYIFWELVGFASYLLIGYWFTKDSAVHANKKAFLVNRIGDIGFLIGIALIYSHVGTLDLTMLFGPSGVFNPSSLEHGQSLVIDTDASWRTWAGICFFLGAMAKSAQFPLHIWLPDAMEGPTSVSSLIHAATMVAAGVFLLCTIFPLFNATVLLLIAIIGTLTAISGAIFALGQQDIKKILAFSTISQLGFMMVGVGIGAWDSAIFHLGTHAFFKCLLFLCAGAVIHEMAHLKKHRNLEFDPQNLRNMGGLRKYMPKTFLCMSIASLALAGFPLTAGYLSKDSIVVGAFEWGAYHGGWHMIIPITLIIVSILTAFYIGRLIWKAFFGNFRFADLLNTDHTMREAPVLMLAPMIFLALCCFAPAFSLQPLDYHASWLMQGLHVQTAYPAIPSAHLYIPVILSIGAIVSWFIGWKWYTQREYPFSTGNKLVQLANNQFYLNEFNEVIFVNSIKRLSGFLYFVDRKVVDGLTYLFTNLIQSIARAVNWLDKNVIDGLVNMVANSTYYLGHLVRHVQNGQLQGYLGFALTVLILGFLYLIIK